MSPGSERTTGQPRPSPADSTPVADGGTLGFQLKNHVIAKANDHRPKFQLDLHKTPAKDDDVVGEEESGSESKREGEGLSTRRQYRGEGDAASDSTDNKEMDELMSFLDEIESNAEQYLGKHGTKGLDDLDEDVVALKNPMSDRETQDDNPFSESTLHRVINVARHIHTEH